MRLSDKYCNRKKLYKRASQTDRQTDRQAEDSQAFYFSQKNLFVWKSNDADLKFCDVVLKPKKNHCDKFKQPKRVIYKWRHANFNFFDHPLPAVTLLSYVLCLINLCYTITNPLPLIVWRHFFMPPSSLDWSIWHCFCLFSYSRLYQLVLAFFSYEVIERFFLGTF